MTAPRRSDAADDAAVAAAPLAAATEPHDPARAGARERPVPVPRTRALWREGLWERNPALVTLLGLCPLLALGNSTVNAIGLGLATLATLLVTNVLVSLTRAWLAESIRLPVQVLIIATTVTTIEMTVRAWLPALHAALGIFLPLIVTNCLILGRARTFASRQPPGLAAIDALATGGGFLGAIVALGAARELIGQGTLLADAALLFGPRAADWRLELFDAEHALVLALLPPGAFIGLGLMIAARNAVAARRQGRDTSTEE